MLNFNILHYLNVEIYIFIYFLFLPYSFFNLVVCWFNKLEYKLKKKENGFRRFWNQKIKSLKKQKKKQVLNQQENTETSCHLGADSYVRVQIELCQILMT